MLINWFTVAAQALNFLILVGLLKHFLYKPILTAIDAREKRIAGELADAATKQGEAQKERDAFQHKNEDFDRERAALLSKATDEATAERERLLAEARQAADILSAERREVLKSDVQSVNQAITRRTQEEVFAIARKVLTDLATASLEERLVAVFTRRLRELDDKTKADLAAAIQTASDAALVRSAFELPTEQRAVIQNALNEAFSAEIRVRFEAAPATVCGIELSANGRKVGWSMADYLTTLERAVGELLKESDKTGAEAPPKADARAVPKTEDSKAEARANEHSV
jgi:F-type H+-transporting ATPase subunit b